MIDVYREPGRVRAHVAGYVVDEGKGLVIAVNKWDLVEDKTDRTFAQYTEFSNVVDQIPKPFTPELLRSGVANALQLGEMVVQAQRTRTRSCRVAVFFSKSAT